MHRFLFVALAVLAFLSPSPARETGASALDQALLDLSSDLRVACLAAHPDDEDAATLALLRMGHGVRTTILAVTRGEGGQNEAGPELYADLAAVRTREMRAAAAMIGARVHYLDFEDFGFSRTAEETFEKWGREEMLRRFVRAYRQVRPHVVVTNHDASTGHGHHQATGIIALEAFDAAADPEKFPEEGKPWAVKKLFVRCAEEEATARPDVGRVDPVRGLSYAELGLRSLKVHESQGTWDWISVTPGPLPRNYKLVRSRLDPRGEEAILAGLPIPRPQWLEEAARSGRHAEIVDRVLKAKAPADEVGRALGEALGVGLRVELAEAHLTVGDRGSLEVWVVNGGPRTLSLSGLNVTAADGLAVEPPKVQPRTLAPGAAAGFTVPVSVAPDAPPNRPLARHLTDEEEGRFRVEVSATIALDGKPFAVRREIALPVFPEVSVAIKTWGRLVRPITGRGFMFVAIQNHTAEKTLTGPLELSFSGTDRIQPELPESVTVPPGRRVTVGVTLHALEEAEPTAAEVEAEFRGAKAKRSVRIMDVNLPDHLRVGVVATRGDAHYRALRAMGIEPDLLTDEVLETADLTEYDTIILGIRPYRNRPILHQVNQSLLDFVASGGTLIVNYSKDREWREEYAPFLLKIGRDRVTREDAPIDFEDEKHDILTFPNPVAKEDFDGWVQERGLYFPSDWDRDEFKVILWTADPQQKRIPGLLVGRYGKGAYIYTSLVWYRQLRTLNPAALKMLANMVTYPFRR